MRQVSVPSRVVSVRDIPRAGQPRWESTASESLVGLTDGPVEACSTGDSPVVPCHFHPFIATLDMAFADHRPLVLTPDMFWLLIAQGFARIVNSDPEGMRDRFVQHAGKIEIEIRRDEFVAGSPDNDWPGVFGEFSEAIRGYVGLENHEALVTTFSTTGPIERAANEIVFLDAMQNYFEYKVMSVCGIPEIVLEGTPQDWAHLSERAQNLRDRYDCGWWLGHVVPLLDRVASAASGAEDPALWDSIYKLKSASGGPYASGWITQFFPFLQSMPGLARNRLLGTEFSELGGVEDDGRLREGPYGVTTPEWPGALSVAPFVWKTFTNLQAMLFVAGFTHCTQDKETLALRPGIGWAVRPVPPQEVPSSWLARFVRRFRHS